MSLTYTVFIGPYARCCFSGAERDYTECGVQEDRFHRLHSDSIEGEHWLAGNHKGDPGITFYPCEESPRIVYREPEAILETSKFIETYAADLELLRDMYDSVTVEWGVILKVD